MHVPTCESEGESESLCAKRSGQRQDPREEELEILDGVLGFYFWRIEAHDDLIRSRLI